MSSENYSMSFTTGSLFHRESVKLAVLYLDLGDWNFVRNKVIAENLLQTRTLNTLKRVCREVISRLKTLNSGELEFLIEGSHCGMAEFGTLNAEQQKQITRPFNEFTATIERQKLIAVIRDTLRRFEESDYQRQLSQMTTWAQPVPPPPEPAPETGGTATPDEGAKPTPPAKSEPRIEYVPSRAVKVLFEKAWLADETDVDRYLESMRKALLEEIRKGKRIQI